MELDFSAFVSLFIYLLVICIWASLGPEEDSP